MPQFLAVDMLPSSYRPDDLRRLLPFLPSIRRLGILRGRAGHSLGSAVIEVADAPEREAVIKALDGIEIFGQSLRVSRLDGNGVAE